MSDRAVFLDRDGTIARDVPYCSKPEDFELLATVPEAIRLLNNNGFKVVVVTNQSGIARGYLSKQTLARIHKKMEDELKKHGARVDAIYYCPHHPDEGCECRKPKTVLFLRATRELDIDLSRSYVVGDMQMDIDAGKALGCKTVLVTSEPQRGNDVIHPPDYIVDNLLEAALWIVKKAKSVPEPITSILVPAYNEEEGLPIILAKIFKVINGSYEVIVVDDGSDDRTSEVAWRFPCRVIRHEMNKGKGEAIKTGIKNARGENIICIDADDTYPAEVIPQIAQSLGNYDVVVGSRFYGRENIPRFNRIGNFVFRNMIKYIYGFKPFDPLTGLWGIKKHYAERILPNARYAPDAEMQIKAVRMKLRMQDIKISYSPRVGNTKLPSMKGGYEHLKLILTLLRWHPNRRRNE